MDLSEEILLHLLERREAKIEVTFPGLNFTAAELVESAAYCALAQIKKILEDDSPIRRHSANASLWLGSSFSLPSDARAFTSSVTVYVP